MIPQTLARAIAAACIATSLCAAEPASHPPTSSQKGGEQAVPAPVDQSKLVTVKLLSTSDLVTPGDDVVILLEATVAPGWHTYWQGYSETGFPLKPKWTLPDGWRVVNTEWPVPKRHISPGEILDHVYEGVATLVVTLKAPPAAPPGGRATVEVDVAWLACQEACIPGHAKAEIELEIAPPGARPSASNIDALMSARAALAMPLVRQSPVATGTLEQRETGWVYRIRAVRAERIRFFPGAECATLPNLIREGDVAGTESVLTINANAGDTPRIQGIVQIVYPGDADSGKPGRVSSFSIDTQEPENRPDDPSASPSAANPGR